jgi:hypothetical protein
MNNADLEARYGWKAREALAAIDQIGKEAND